MEYVKENFDYDAVIEWHEDVYKCALNRKNEKRWGAKLLMKKQDVQISIIVPIYKVEKYLVRCVESLIAQDFSSLEIILVEDGSP